MLGHLKPKLCNLQPATKDAYINLYCSLCASLRKQNGLPYGIFINNELTLVLLAFKPYYQTIAGRTNCPSAALMRKRNMSKHPAIADAAQLSLLLGWIKMTDWTFDYPVFWKKQLLKHFDKKVKPILNILSEEFQDVLKKYLILTQTNVPDFQVLQEISGSLSQQIALAVGRQTDAPDEVKEQIARLFKVSGELILLTDHLTDLEKDIHTKQYNGIWEYAKTNEIDLAKAYIQFYNLFNELNSSAFKILTELYQKGIVHKAFTQAFEMALKQISQKVDRAKPDYVDAQYKISPVLDEKPVLVKNECGECCGGCCECSGCDCCSCEAISCESTLCCQCCDGDHKSGGCCQCNDCKLKSCSKKEDKGGLKLDKDDYDTGGVNLDDNKKKQGRIGGSDSLK